MNDDRQLLVDMAQAMSVKKKRKYEKNPFLVIREGLLKIKTKKGEYKRLRLNPVQEKLLTEIEKLWQEGKPIRIWVLKARQQGVSTLLEAVIYVLTAFRKNVNSFIISDDIDGSNYLFDMSKLYHAELKRLDPCLVPDTKRSNAKELVFESTRSQILIDTAKNAAAGRKYTFQRVHLSEIAFYDHPEELMTGLLQSVPDLPGTIVIGETTANGVGNYFYTEWKRAERGESGWIPLFFPWFDNPAEYSLPFDSEEDETELRNTLDDEERSLIDNFKVNYLQLNWRRMCIRDKCRGDLDVFHQEHPAYPDEAFLVSGRPRFDAHRVKAIYEHTLSQQYSQGILAFPNDRELLSIPGVDRESVLFYPDPNGEWKVWEMPDSRHEYVIFADTAGGEEIEGASEGKKGDYNVIQVFRRPHIHEQRADSPETSDALVQVAEYRSRIDPDLLADEVYLAWIAYGKPPSVGVEVNNHGRTTADHLKARCPVYRREVMDETTRKITKKLGWLTDKNTKKLMIDDLASAIREGWIIINSTTLASECQTYTIGSDGSTNAQQGCFDDSVMAAAGAVQMHLRIARKSAFKVIQMKNKAMGRQYSQGEKW